MNDYYPYPKFVTMQLCLLDGIIIKQSVATRYIKFHFSSPAKYFLPYGTKKKITWTIWYLWCNDCTNARSQKPNHWISTPIRVSINMWHSSKDYCKNKMFSLVFLLYILNSYVVSSYVFNSLTVFRLIRWQSNNDLRK